MPDGSSNQSGTERPPSIDSETKGLLRRAGWIVHQIRPHICTSPYIHSRLPHTDHSNTPVPNAPKGRSLPRVLWEERIAVHALWSHSSALEASAIGECCLRSVLCDTTPCLVTTFDGGVIPVSRRYEGDWRGPERLIKRHLPARIDGGPVRWWGWVSLSARLVSQDSRGSWGDGVAACGLLYV